MQINNLSLTVLTLKADSIKYGSRCIIKSLIKDPRFRVNFWLRIGCYLNGKHFLFKSILLRRIKNKLAVKYGFDTTFNVQIGKGLRIIHLGGIVVHGNCTIGENFTILNNVTLGQGKRNPSFIPAIGNNVYIGVSSVLLGKINIGNNVIIGALTFVNKSISDGITVAGSPMRVIEKDS
jgi:serine O-acetyltransferase